jgi:hypothetical protein
VDRNTKLLVLLVIIAIAVPLGLTALFLAGNVDDPEVMMQALLLSAMTPLIVLSAYMWATGKGAMLIAGYNTSSQAVRDSYDSTALAKFVGMVVTIAMVLMTAGLELLVLNVSMVLFWLLLIASIAILFGAVIYMNTGKRFLREGASPVHAMSAKDRKRSRKIAIASLAVTAIILIAVFAFIGSGKVSASLDPDGLQVSAPFVNEKVPYEGITSVELRTSFDDGRRVGGFGGTEVSSGNFQNNELGRYVLARYNSVPNCIVVHHAGEVLVFNLVTADDTTSMYHELLTKL